MHRRSIAGQPMMDGGTITNFTARQITRPSEVRNGQKGKKWQTELHGDPRRRPPPESASLIPATIRLHCVGTPGFHSRPPEHRNDCRGNHVREPTCPPSIRWLYRDLRGPNFGSHRKTGQLNSVWSSLCCVISMHNNAQRSTMGYLHCVTAIVPKIYPIYATVGCCIRTILKW